VSDVAQPTDAKPADAVVVVEEKPFNLDLLQSCTARMTHQCWQTYLSMKNDLLGMQTRPVRATLTARSDKGLDELQGLLVEAGVTAKTRRDTKTLDFTATFAQIQRIIKHPQTHTIDAVKL
jgi:hypothetical protein